MTRRLTRHREFTGRAPLWPVQSSLPSRGDDSERRLPLFDSPRYRQRHLAPTREPSGPPTRITADRSAAVRLLLASFARHYLNAPDVANAASAVWAHVGAVCWCQSCGDFRHPRAVPDASDGQAALRLNASFRPYPRSIKWGALPIHSPGDEADKTSRHSALRRERVGPRRHGRSSAARR